MKVLAIQEYCKNQSASERSVNVDLTNRTLSVVDEHEANNVLTDLY